MSSLNFNKIAGAVLATGLAIVGLRELSAGVFTHEAPAKPGFAVEVAADTAGGPAAADVPPDWGTVLPAADMAAGEAVFAKCKACHNADNGGPNLTGPNLYGVVGRKPASHPGFAYSASMTGFSAKQPTWDYEHIYEFVKNPQAYVPGTKMTFVGLKQPQDRINVIAYLHAQGSSLPIPAPNPAAAAAGFGASPPRREPPRRPRPAPAARPATARARPGKPASARPSRRSRFANVRHPGFRDSEGPGARSPSK
jgi:cytochrome c